MKQLIANRGMSLQAIETCYKGPTDHRGSRIIVRAQCARMTIPWDHALNAEENHAAAAEAFIRTRGWDSWPGSWNMGASASGSGYVFAFARKDGE